MDQLDQVLPLTRSCWGEGDVDQSCVTSQTVAHVVQKQVLPQMSRADTSEGCCLGHCSTYSMLSSCRGEKNSLAPAWWLLSTCL